MLTIGQFADVKFDPTRGLSRQIRRHVRQLILSGQAQPGEKLPGTRELAELWRTHVPTVHEALAPLVAEGLLIRSPGIGTIVAQREERLTRVGISSTTLPGQKLNPYAVQLRGEVERLLAQAGAATRFFPDDQPDVPDGTPLLALVEAARDREVQGVIFLQSTWERLKWQLKLPVPTAFQGSADFPNKVDNNLAQLAEESLRRLQRQGCRSVGLITPVRPLDPRAEQKHRSGDDLFARLVSVAGELGLELRNEWMRTPPQDHVPIGQERFGYQQFQQLWDLPQRPDGLLVFPESTSRGVVTALLERRVPVPRDLRLVLARNPQLEFFVPRPVTFADAGTAAVAAALVTQLQRQLRGESCAPITISFDFVANAGGEQSVPAGNERKILNNHPARERKEPEQ